MQHEKQESLSLVRPLAKLCTATVAGLLARRIEPLLLDFAAYKITSFETLLNRVKYASCRFRVLNSPRTRAGVAFLPNRRISGSLGANKPFFVFLPLVFFSRGHDSLCFEQ